MLSQEKEGKFFALPILFPILWDRGEREVVCICMVLRCLLGLSHKRASLGSQVFHPL